MKMTIEGSIACLSDEQQCKYCKYASENCRQDAIDVAVQSMKAFGNYRKIVEDFFKDCKEIIKEG